MKITIEWGVAPSEFAVELWSNPRNGTNPKTDLIASQATGKVTAETLQKIIGEIAGALTAQGAKP